MINFNGEIISNANAQLSISNRGFAYGDALFETIRVNGTEVLFWEDHYFRLMASMRILRMRIPMEFTLEYLEKQILDTIASHGLPKTQSVRVKLSVYRNSKGLYTPESNGIAFFIAIKKLDTPFYSNTNFKDEGYRIELYKDHYLANDLLSTLKTNNRVLNVLAGIFAKENDFKNLLLLNTDKKIVEAINGNLFLVKDNIIKTPSLKEGGINGVFRKQLINLIQKNPNYSIEETSISAFELQKADELFVTNVISGISSISNYRKKKYTNTTANELLKLLNAKLRLS